MAAAKRKAMNQPMCAPGETDDFARSLCDAYQEFCDRFLPIASDCLKWRFSRAYEADDPDQGWKLHVSATVLTANDVIRRVVPFLCERNVLYKAPSSLDELDLINSGLFNGYSQVGKFITVYPRSDQETVRLAQHLHKLTRGIAAPRVPFDIPYREGSCVYYRYGAFSPLDIINPDGTRTPAIRTPEGGMIADSRESVEGPAWVVDPFSGKPPRKNAAKPPGMLHTTIHAFRALSQRGKGGVYQAIDLGVSPPRLCALKQGRANGEVKWDGRDGHWRVRNEEHVLRQLQLAGIAVPQVYTSFESEGHYYLVMEFIEGNNLNERLCKRQRRLSIRQVVRYAIQLSLLVSRIHAAGWVWRDCKPANLIITKGGRLRPVDFEGAFPTDRPDTFFWNTPEFAPPESAGDAPCQSGVAEDLYALGAVIYFLITGRQPGVDPVPASAWRRGVPQLLDAVVSELLSRDPRCRPDGLSVAHKLEQNFTPLAAPRACFSPSLMPKKDSPQRRRG